MQGDPEAITVQVSDVGNLESESSYAFEEKR